MTTLSRTVAIALVVIASASILSTARVFSGTVDEPAHIAAGMQWLTTGDYDYDLQHPPLGRIATSIGPYLRGERTTGAPAVFDEGARILGAGPHYVDTLAVARHGVIVFFLLLAFVVWLWGRRALGEAGGALATLFLVTNPNILAHAGLATTDVSCAATTTLALFVALWWTDRPSWQRSIALGAALALAIGSRLSAVAFIGAAMLACIALRAWCGRPWTFTVLRMKRGTAVGLALAALTCLVVIWAEYRFAIGPMKGGTVSLPAPAFIDGMNTFLLHGSTGHAAFLLGTPSNHGWWYYFPVAVAVKTPLPLLLLSVIGAAAAVKGVREQNDWRGAVPLVSAAAILGISLLVRVDIGVRLVLPIYPLLAIVAAQGAIVILASAASRESALKADPPLASLGRMTFVGIVVASAALTAVRAYPDWLAYFNPLAGDHPERILVDSNLDWGQDLYRLRDTIAARGITDSVYVAYFGTADVSAAGVPRARLLFLHEHRPGWIAASETYLAGEWTGGAYQWLLEFPSETRIGPSMRLWHIPPPPARPPTTTGSSPR